MHSDSSAKRKMRSSACGSSAGPAAPAPVQNLPVRARTQGIHPERLGRTHRRRRCVAFALERVLPQRLGQRHALLPPPPPPSLPTETAYAQMADRNHRRSKVRPLPCPSRLSNIARSESHRAQLFRICPRFLATDVRFRVGPIASLVRSKPRGDGRGREGFGPGALPGRWTACWRTRSG